ncbi:hypothetical protein B0T10DRAFT_66512 [Thelonectria olida]|uniref:Uncharacterized protein n=1 Tax=Thelonectria olida TaxID=1576542 RepID=A0A9P8W3D8_9HYPO|nr:hypothetical protein B0T10DRAFT_66512 [Thelonectria olida]
MICPWTTPAPGRTRSLTRTIQTVHFVSTLAPAPIGSVYFLFPVFVSASILSSWSSPCVAGTDRHHCLYHADPGRCVSVCATTIFSLGEPWYHASQWVLIIDAGLVSCQLATYVPLSTLLLRSRYVS